MVRVREAEATVAVLHRRGSGVLIWKAVHSSARLTSGSAADRTAPGSPPIACAQSPPQASPWGTTPYSCPLNQVIVVDGLQPTALRQAARAKTPGSSAHGAGGQALSG